MFENFVPWRRHGFAPAFRSDRRRRIIRIPESVLYLALCLYTQTILKAEVNSDSVTVTTATIPEPQIQECYAPPTGAMPTDVLCLSDRYWVFSGPQNSVGAAGLNFKYHGLPPLLPDQQLVVLMRAGSVSDWQKLEPASYQLCNRDPQTGAGEIQLLNTPTAPALFTLGITSTPFSAHGFENLQAAIFYGPIHLSWQSRGELLNHYFQIERQINASGWEIIGKVAAQGVGLLPNTYYFEDLSQLGQDSPLAYRIRWISPMAPVTDSPILKLWYSPFPATAGLRSARIDSGSRYLNLVFQLVVNSYVQIELFDQAGHGRQILFQREMAAGCYSQMVTLPPDWQLKATDFCRLELKTVPGKYSFIQIQPVRGLSDKNIACE